MKPKILCVWGTRPEAIKMAPVVFALRREKRLITRTCVTAQHRQLLDQALRVLRIRPDHDLDLMRPNQSLEETAARVLKGVGRVLRREQPDLVLVQGDTTTAFAAALAAFQQRIPVGHVEAGLRTHDFTQPFPEEMNRVLVDAMSTLLFAPTALSKRNLLKEGIPSRKVIVTGNTIIDALQFIKPSLRSRGEGRVGSAVRRLILVTAHRRESFGPPLESICRALVKIVDAHEDVEILFPVHPNPSVQKTARRLLRQPRIHLTAPMDYSTFLSAMQDAYLILTDSGGIQEEAPSFGKPVIVLRKVTERTEAAQAGAAFIAGTDAKRIVALTTRLLIDPKLYRRMASFPNPFGDGKASHRIVTAILRHFH